MLHDAYFDRFELNLAPDEVQAVSHQGDCHADAAYAVTLPYIVSQLDEIGADALRDELREYGAWDDEELSDDDANRIRIVWIAAGNIQEDM